MKKICEQIQQEMGAYLYESPSPEIQKHLENCKNCQEQLQKLQQTQQQITALLPQPDIAMENEMKAMLHRQLQNQSLPIQTTKAWIWMTIAASIMTAFTLGVWVGHKSSIPAPQPRISRIIPKKRVTEKPRIPTKLTWLSKKGLHFLKHGNHPENRQKKNWFHQRR